ncbi:MAG TPA: hypothetical protein VFQ39_04185 [Longimicrobium sp.]|nr:hypothetical protein [Longimicrobium sp.]
MISLLIAAAAALGGFIVTRGFVRDRLKYVDAAQSGAFPWIVGIGAGLAIGLLNVIPIVGWFIPAALPLGLALGAGTGTAVGQQDIRRHRLNP